IRRSILRLLETSQWYRPSHDHTTEQFNSDSGVSRYCETFARNVSLVKTPGQPAIQPCSNALGQAEYPPTHSSCRWNRATVQEDFRENRPCPRTRSSFCYKYFQVDGMLTISAAAGGIADGFGDCPRTSNLQSELYP